MKLGLICEMPHIIIVIIVVNHCNRIKVQLLHVSAFGSVCPELKTPAFTLFAWKCEHVDKFSMCREEKKNEKKKSFSSFILTMLSFNILKNKLGKKFEMIKGLRSTTRCAANLFSSSKWGNNFAGLSGVGELQHFPRLKSKKSNSTTFSSLFSCCLLILAHDGKTEKLNSDCGYKKKNGRRSELYFWSLGKT